MFFFDHRDDFLRRHPFEGIEAGRCFLGRGAADHRFGALFAERGGQHRLDLDVGAIADRRPVARAIDEPVEHAVDLVGADIGDRIHHAAELLDFVGFEARQNAGGFVFGKQQEQDRSGLLVVDDRRGRGLVDRRCDRFDFGVFLFQDISH